MSNDAIHPDYFKDFRKLTITKELEGIEDLEKEEKALSEMSYTNGWEALRQYIEELMLVLDTPAKTAMENGCSYDEIGRKTIVSELTKEFLQKIIDRVQDARTANDRK